MTIAKTIKASKIGLIDTKPTVRKRQVILFGACISSLASATAIGYMTYVSNASVQEYFLKIIYR